jgi:hypothetical protein
MLPCSHRFTTAATCCETDRLLGHRGAGAELVGLDQDAAGKLEAGEPCVETQVVLYPGARARLAP